MVLGMTPLTTSVLRLVVIATLFAANKAALYRTCKLAKSGLMSFQRVTILTILLLNFMYLSVIWAPFTITALKHDLQSNRSEALLAPSPLMTEDIMRSDTPQALDTYPQQPGGVRFSQASQSYLGETLNNWNIQVQDIITSSFTYSLMLTFIVRKLMMEKGLEVGKLKAFIDAVVLAVIPLPLTLAVRGLVLTADLFTLHTSEVKSGYTLFSIICDVHITKTYVLGIFLEVTMMLLVATLVLGITRWQGKTHTGENKTRRQKDASLQVEEVACKFVLMTGITWAWPIKPLFVLVLYFFIGPHWNNVVCWLSNMVVAIPVSFMPLAVFLTRPKKTDTCPTKTTKDDIAAVEAAGDDDAVEAAEGHSTLKPAKIDVSSQCAHPQDVGLSPAVSSSVPDVHKDALGKGSQIRENLKFYLGTDIFKKKGIKEDEVCILDNQEGNESPV